MTKLEELQNKIEEQRARLDSLMDDIVEFDAYYEESVKLDRLIEEYIELSEHPAVLEEEFIYIG